MQVIDYLQELLTTAHVIFGAAPNMTLIFETSNLDICQDALVEIHSAVWEAISQTVSTVEVKIYQPPS